MLNPGLDLLTDYPFTRLRALLDAEPLPAGITPINLSIGEPQHAMPDFVATALTRDLSSLSRYPTSNGSPELRNACANWLKRRYALPDGVIDAEKQIVALNGTREGLFMVAQVVIPPKKGPKGANGEDQRPIVLMPNPFYQAYVGAAAACGAEPYFVPALPENGFMPDFAGLPREIL
ncbi:MAG: aminotransferase class I/II-fold pyridoxal phosphate-dependent enzyme, partial [Ferrovibrio sp.]